MDRHEMDRHEIQPNLLQLYKQLFPDKTKMTKMRDAIARLNVTNNRRKMHPIREGLMSSPGFRNQSFSRASSRSQQVYVHYPDSDSSEDDEFVQQTSKSTAEINEDYAIRVSKHNHEHSYANDSFLVSVLRSNLFTEMGLIRDLIRD
jgi:hypothetical protein